MSAAAVKAHRRKLRQMEDNEQIARDEASFKEEDEWHSIALSWRRIANLHLQKENKLSLKRAREATLSEKRLRRRLNNVSNREQRQRLVVMETEQLELQVILRQLEKDVRRGVFDIVADAALRKKYLNKTVDVIVHNEQVARREYENTERYERLVLKSRFDTQSTELVLVERLTKLRQQTEVQYRRQRSNEFHRQESTEKHHEGHDANGDRSDGTTDARRGEKSGTEHKPDEPQPAATTETSEGEGNAHPDAPTESGNAEPTAADAIQTPNQGEEEQSKSAAVEQSPQATPTNGSPNVPAKISRRHSQSFFERSFRQLEAREAKRREQIAAEMGDGVDQLIVVLDHVAERQMLEADAIADALLRSRNVFQSRQRMQFIKLESTERDNLKREESAGLKSIERRYFKDLAAQVRIETADIHQQQTHDRRIEQRKHHIFAQQFRMEQQTQRQELLSWEEEAWLPATAPMTPLFSRGQTPHTKSESDAASVSNSSLRGGFLSGSAKRSLWAYRTVASTEAAQRQLLEREERLSRHATCCAFSEKPSYEQKQLSARARREHVEQDAEDRAIARLVYEDERAGVARILRLTRKAELALAELQKHEAAARIEVFAELKAFERQAQHTLVQLGKMHGMTLNFLQTEQSVRQELTDAEARMRLTLIETSRLHRPAPPRKPPPAMVLTRSFHYAATNRSRTRSRSSSKPRGADYNEINVKLYHRRKRHRIHLIPSIHTMLAQETLPREFRKPNAPESQRSQQKARSFKEVAPGTQERDGEQSRGPDAQERGGSQTCNPSDDERNGTSMKRGEPSRDSLRGSSKGSARSEKTPRKLLRRQEQEEEEARLRESRSAEQRESARPGSGSGRESFDSENLSPIESPSNPTDRPPTTANDTGNPDSNPEESPGGPGNSTVSRDLSSRYADDFE